MEESSGNVDPDIAWRRVGSTHVAIVDAIRANRHFRARIVHAADVIGSEYVRAGARVG
jgi:hypothetical protein